MTRHIDLLAVFYQMWGALALVAGSAVLVLAFGVHALSAPGFNTPLHTIMQVKFAYTISHLTKK